MDVFLIMAVLKTSGIGDSQQGNSMWSYGNMFKEIPIDSIAAKLCKAVCQAVENWLSDHMVSKWDCHSSVENTRDLSQLAQNSEVLFFQEIDMHLISGIF